MHAECQTAAVDLGFSVSGHIKEIQQCSNFLCQSVPSDLVIFNALEYRISSDLRRVVAGSRTGSSSGAHGCACAYGYTCACAYGNCRTGSSAHSDNACPNADHNHAGARDNDDDFGCEQPHNGYRLQHSGILIEFELQHGKNGWVYHRAICDRGGYVPHRTSAPGRNSSQRGLLLASPYG